MLNQQKKKQKAKTGSSGDGDDDFDQDDDQDQIKLKGAISQAIVIEKPNVKWDDVAGLETAKQLLKEAVILPIKFPQLFQGKRKPWTGILLYGPPGTGKSYLAKAVATEANNSTFFSVSSSDLVSKYVGESEKLVKQLFDLAREKKPSIIFIDEIDSLGAKRGEHEQDHARRIKTEFFIQMQGVGKNSENILILGATNCPWDLDSALRRRFTKRVYIPLPDKDARKQIFRIHVGDSHNMLNDNDYEILAQKTNGFSGSDIAGVVQDALMEPIRTMQLATHFKRIPNLENQSDSKDDMIWIPCSPSDNYGMKMSLLDIPIEEQSKVRAEPLCVGHFLRVLSKVKPSVGKEDIQKHIQWTQEFGQEG